VRDRKGARDDETSRRKFLHLAAGAAALPAVSRISRAQAIRHGRCGLFVATRGGRVDIYARLIAQWLSERLGQQFIVRTSRARAGRLPRKRS